MNHHIIISIISLIILGLSIYLYKLNSIDEFFANPFYIADPIDFNMKKINAIQDKCFYLRNTSEWKSCMYNN
jgi:hypothetical protein